MSTRISTRMSTWAALPPDVPGGWQRRIATSSLRPLAAFALLGLFWGSWAALVPAVAARLRVGDGPLGLAMMATIVGAIPALTLAARLGNQRGQPWLAPACAGFGLAAAATALAPGYAWLVAALALVGAASGMLDVLMNSAVSEIEIDGRDAGRGTRRMHLAHSCYSGGVCVGAIGAGALRQGGMDARAILLGAAGTILLGSLLTRQAPGAPAAVAIARPAGRRRLQGTALLLGLICGLAFMVESGLELWSALHLERDLHADAAVAGLGPGLLALAAVGGRLSGQLLGERLGDARLVLLAGLVAAAGVAGFALAPTWQMALPALLLAGAGVSVAAPTIVGLAGRLAAPGEQGSAVAACSQVAYVGILLAPLLLGQLSAAVGLRDGLLSLVGCGLLFGLGGSAAITALCRSRTLASEPAS